MPHDRPSVLILHQAPAEETGWGGVWRESDAGVMEETKAAAVAMERLRFPHRTVGVSCLAEVPAVLAGAPEDVVFNLVESFPSRPADAAAVPALCRAFGKAWTGADTPCLLLSLDKGYTKALLQAAGLPVPAAVVVRVGETAGKLPAGPYIVKPVSMDASEGIDAASVVARRGRALGRAVARIHREFGQPAMIEQFIAGRELNVSLLAREGRVDVLPIAEIEFSTFPPGMPRIVDYAAKWLPESFEYRHTPRVIPARLTAGQARTVRRLARAAWDAVGCSGYARVDFRLDVRGRPTILEVNANPDISDDAGFAAALGAAGISFEQFVESAVRGACEQSGGGPSSRRAKGPKRSRRAPTIRWTEPRDRETVLQFVARTGFFRDDEVAVAQELLDEALAKGPEGHYQSFVAEGEGGAAAGWVCYGPTPCTIGTFDIYWIVVAPEAQGRGLGRALMAFAEEQIAQRGGRMAVIETSGRPIYDPTRQFYLGIGYREAARIADFYAPGDAKVAYTKRL